MPYDQALLESRREGWEGKYMDYRALKTCLITSSKLGLNHAFHSNGMTNSMAGFECLLRQEMEKVSLFVLYKQGQIANQVGALRVRTSTTHNDTLNYPEEEKSMQENHHSTLVEAYTYWAIELLHLQRFVCVNAMGFRKIIKKYHEQRNYHHRRKNKNAKRKRKQYQHQDDRQDEEEWPEDASSPQPAPTFHDPHLQHLAASSSVAAIHSSLSQACQELQALSYKTLVSYHSRELSNQESKSEHEQQRYAWIRFYLTVSIIQVLRDHAQRLNLNFWTFLSNKAHIIGSSNVGNGDRAMRQAMSVFLHFQPDAIFQLEPSQLDAWDENKAGVGNGPPNLLEGIEIPMHGQGDLPWGGTDTVSLAINLTSKLLYTVRLLR